jgi:hypothetical protein
MDHSVREERAPLEVRTRLPGVAVVGITAVAVVHNLQMETVVAVVVAAAALHMRMEHT